MNKISKIILATTNNHKIIEIMQILDDFPIKLIPLSKLGKIEEIIENGKTFEENALIKAKTIYQNFKIPSLAEDSGLVIPALNGEPGVKSARYGSICDEKPSHQILIKRVLKKMENIPSKERKAFFVCVVCLIIDHKTHFITKGICHGEIISSPVGKDGFGYNSIFYIPEINKTMAEISNKAKSSINHRFKAITELKNKFFNYFQYNNN